ncbi:MAG: FAD-dependent oxidoreductase [Desulfobacterales bacterium]
MSDRPLGSFDSEMVTLLQDASAAEGIRVHCQVEITAIEKIGHPESRYLIRTAGGETFTADLVVHGAGRVPDLEDLGLDAARINYSAGHHRG